jgi:AraC-like DNA-binding protein
MPIGAIYRPLLEIAHEAGVDVGELLGRFDLTEPRLLDAGTRLSPERSRTLARELFDRIGDPEVGLRAAERVRLPDVDLLGYLVRHSPHPLAALEQMARYAQLLGDTARGQVECRGERVLLTFALTDGSRMLPEAADYWVAGVFLFVRGLSCGQASPTEVHIPRPRPRQPDAYRRFFGCAVSFASEHALLAYGESCLTVPFAEGDPRLVAILQRQADEVMSTLPARSDLVERVAAHMRRHLHNGHTHLAAIARELGMSERTLRRRLRDHGSGHRALLDRVRRERAVALIEQGDTSLATIAHGVGFADEAAFARAFRRWTGLSPQAYRSR